MANELRTSLPEELFDALTLRTAGVEGETQFRNPVKLKSSERMSQLRAPLLHGAKREIGTL